MCLVVLMNSTKYRERNSLQKEKKGNLNNCEALNFIMNEVLEIFNSFQSNKGGSIACKKIRCCLEGAIYFFFSQLNDFPKGEKLL